MIGGGARSLSRRAALGGLGGLALSACRRRRTALRTIRLGSVPRMSVAPVYVADDLGFFRDAGLALDLTLLGDTTQSVPLLVAGRIDVSMAAATPALFNAIGQGARVRLAAGREIALPDCSREVSGNRARFPGGFTRAAQLEGKRVAVTSPTSLTAYLLDVLLESAGLTVADIERLFMRTAESGPALVSGQIDAVVDLDMAFSSPELVAGPSIARIIPGFQYNHFVFGPSLVDGDVGLGAAFLTAYFRGVRAYRAGTMPIQLERLAQGSGMGAAAARRACRDRLTENGEIDLASVQRLLDWARTRGFLRTAVTAEQAVDRRFLEAALG